MTSKLQEAKKKKLVNPPRFVCPNLMYETMMGSVAYGVSTDYSDVDIYGFCIPSREYLFPHEYGHIQGFGKKPPQFDQYQQHHVFDKESGKEYDFSIYGIVKYFQLCMENNPNMIDSLYTPRFCVTHSTTIGEMVRENRDMFLHKGSWHKFKGYAYSQLHKMKNKKPEGKRRETVEKYGFDVKFAYHVVRLLSEVEMIMEEGTIDLQRNREQLKAIRRGDVSEEEIIKWAAEKEQALEKLYSESKLQHRPDEEKIKQLLLNCLEEHYGDLSKVIHQENKANIVLSQINEIIEKNKELLK